MKRVSLQQRYELFFATATIAAHATACFNNPNGAFRQRDIKFIVELFSNWVESGFPNYVLDVQNTQIMRFIADLVSEGYARKISRKDPPAFRLTRTGLLELCSRVVSRSYRSEREGFFFLYYFIKNYKPRIEALVKQEGREFPPALRLELESLLDEKSLLTREIDEVHKELKKLDDRIHAALETVKIVQTGKKQSLSTVAIVEQAEKSHPYELNSQKPLSELILGIPENFRLWELCEGNVQRVTQMWEPAKRMLQSYLGELQRIS